MTEPWAIEPEPSFGSLCGSVSPSRKPSSSYLEQHQSRMQGFNGIAVAPFKAELKANTSVRFARSCKWDAWLKGLLRGCCSVVASLSMNDYLHQKHHRGQQLVYLLTDDEALPTYDVPDISRKTGKRVWGWGWGLRRRSEQAAKAKQTPSSHIHKHSTHMGQMMM